MRQILVTLISVAAAFGGIAAAETVIFSGGSQAPYTLSIGDKDNWGIPVAAEGDTATVNGYLDVTTIAENGVKTARWNGNGDAQLFLSSPQPVDLTAYLRADAALSLIVNVAKPPGDVVTLRMGCGYPCAANADISKLLAALPAGEWVRLTVDLKCFVDGGLDPTKVDTPFLLLTGGAMMLSIADVRIVDGAGPDAIINCH